MKKRPAIFDLLRVMARLRSPKGCPWDRAQDHMSLRWHAVEEVYELMDAIEARDDHELEEELGDLLLQVVIHCQLAKERGAFDFDQVARHITDKLIRRHPHVFGRLKVKSVEQVWANWEKIKRAEKHGKKPERRSVLDGIPKHLPALLRAEKLVKKAQWMGLLDSLTGTRCGGSAEPASGKPPAPAAARPYGKESKLSKAALAEKLFALAQFAQQRGWSAEDLLRGEIRKVERQLRQRERA
jgi:MazG family protein